MANDKTQDQTGRLLGDQRRECSRRVTDFLRKYGATPYQIDGAAAACEEAMLPEMPKNCATCVHENGWQCARGDGDCSYEAKS